MANKISLASYGKDTAQTITPLVIIGGTLYAIKKYIIPAMTWTEYIIFLILLIFAYLFSYHELRIRQLEKKTFRK